MGDIKILQQALLWKQSFQRAKCSLLTLAFHSSISGTDDQRYAQRNLFYQPSWATTESFCNSTRTTSKELIVGSHLLTDQAIEVEFFKAGMARANETTREDQGKYEKS